MSRSPEQGGAAASAQRIPLELAGELLLLAQADRVSAWLDDHDWLGVYGWPDGDPER